MYMPLRNTCARMMATTTFSDDTPAARTESRSETYSIAYRHQLAPGTEYAGTVRAISAETGQTTWLYEQRAATMSLVATGGGLVLGGDVNGRFRAFDHETRLTGEWLSGQLRGQWSAIRRGQYRHWGDLHALCRLDA